MTSLALKSILGLFPCWRVLVYYFSRHSHKNMRSENLRLNKREQKKRNNEIEIKDIEESYKNVYNKC